jgi:hypothetical protein
LEVKKGKGGWEVLILKLKIGLFKIKRPLESREVKDAHSF